MTEPKTPNLLARPPKVINIGLDAFAADLTANGASVQHVQWSPPARGDAAIARLLAKVGS